MLAEGRRRRDDDDDDEDGAAEEWTADWRAEDEQPNTNDESLSQQSALRFHSSASHSASDSDGGWGGWTAPAVADAGAGAGGDADESRWDCAAVAPFAIGPGLSLSEGDEPSLLVLATLG